MYTQPFLVGGNCFGQTFITLDVFLHKISYHNVNVDRCRALEFKASKSQKKILKRFNKSLMGQEEHVAGDAGRRMSTGSSNPDELHGEERDHFVESNKEHQKIDVSSVIKSQIEDNLLTKNGENSSSHVQSGNLCHEFL